MYTFSHAVTVLLLLQARSVVPNKDDLVVSAILTLVSDPVMNDGDHECKTPTHFFFFFVALSSFGLETNSRVVSLND